AFKNPLETLKIEMVLQDEEVFSVYGVLIFIPVWSLVKCRHWYAASFLMDTVYWMSEQVSRMITSSGLRQALKGVSFPVEQGIEFDKKSNSPSLGKF
ncbi:hypothetical protein Tco_0987713, partial [Tanacetum coccineum]